MSVDDAGRPALPAVPIADMATGMQAALAVVAGLRAVAADGSGYRAEVSMLESAVSLTALAAGHIAAGQGTVPAPRDMLTGALACYGYYRCADGGWQAVGALEPKFFRRVCELLGAPELAELQYDLGRQEELRRRLAAIFATRTRDEWTDLLLLEDTCVTPVNDLAEAFTDPNLEARSAVVDAVRSDGAPARVVRAVPWLSEAGDTVPRRSAATRRGCWRHGWERRRSKWPSCVRADASEVPQRPRPAPEMPAKSAGEPDSGRGSRRSRMKVPRTCRPPTSTRR